MAPEQLERRPADARSDIFSCGAVLYEMVTGQRAFAGSNQASVMAAIVERDAVPVAQLVSGVPAALDWMISKCLVKDPEDRWQSAADLKHHLDWIASGTESAQDTTPRSHSALWIAASIAVALGAVGMWAWTAGTVSSPPPAASIFTIEPPAGTAFDLTHAISPDGRRIAFATVRGNSPRELWIRSLDSLTSQHVPGSTRATYPFWSPDGRFVGFVADEKLKKFDVASGAVHVIGDSPGAAGASWNRDDVILFSSALRTATNAAGLWRMSAAGGPPTLVSPKEEGRRYGWPQFLPDGQRFLFTRLWEAEPRVYLGRLDSALPPAPVTAPGVAAVVLAGDVLFFLADTTLMAQRFDTTRMTPVGERVRVADNVHATVPGLAGFHASAGVVTYRASAPAPLTQLTWVDRSGRTVGHLGDPAPTFLVSISPDGRSVLATQRDRERGRTTGTVARIDIDTGASTPLFTNATAAIWSPDGSHTVFTQFGAPAPLLRRATLDGRVPPRAFLDLQRPTHATDWSRDGRFIVGAARHTDTSWDIWIADAEGREPWRYLVRGPHQQWGARISPDGRWMAYEAADARGTPDIYVQSFPDGGGLRRVSTRGGRSPRWRSDGRELYYVEPGGRVMRVFIAAGSEFAPGAPELMFQQPGLTGDEGDGLGYDVAPDGSRFLIAVPTSNPVPSTPIVVILNWTFPDVR
jgi:Tol biopolymer transport system component